MSVFHRLLVKTVTYMPPKVVWLFSKKYIAGTTLKSALDVVRNLNSKGIYATLDVLGEAVKNKEEAIIAKNQAMDALNSIVSEKLMAKFLQDSQKMYCKEIQ